MSQVHVVLSGSSWLQQLYYLFIVTLTLLELCFVKFIKVQNRPRKETNHFMPSIKVYKIVSNKRTKYSNTKLTKY